MVHRRKPMVRNQCYSFSFIQKGTDIFQSKGNFPSIPRRMNINCYAKPRSTSPSYESLSVPGGKATFFILSGILVFMAQGYSMVYVTVKEMSEASKIARHLVERRLIACANMFTIRSVYPWWGKVEEGDEVAMIMKTRSSLVDEVIKEVRKVHSYEVPCIVSYKMEKGLQGYLDWIESETGPKIELKAPAKKKQ